MASKPEQHRLAFILMVLAMVSTTLSDYGVGGAGLGYTNPANGNDLRASTFECVLKGSAGTVDRGE